jgi:RNA polymerase sigma-70 factor (ECF subfamily)
LKDGLDSSARMVPSECAQRRRRTGPLADRLERGSEVPLQATAPEHDRLVALSQEGDLAAFNALVEAYQDQVYGLCWRMLGLREAAEDAAQETFLAAYRNIRRFRGPGFRAWLLRIAANAATDELRRRRRRPQVSLETPTSGGEAAFDPPDTSAGPEEWALRREQARHLQAALLTLPSDQRLAVIMSDVQGLTYEEIGEAMGSSLGTVKSRISRGRARLRRYLLEQRELFPSGQRPTQ